MSLDKEEDTSNLTTWVFEEGTFVPQAKIVGDKTYSIISDHLGTPILSFDENGKKVWERELDIYGKAIKGDSNFIPFLYQGQFFDEETELAYNRFRYYSPDTGMYCSQDPLSIKGGFNVYSYVRDVNVWIDPFGLMDLFRSMAREEFFDIKQNGWNGKENMGSKWFAESFENAVKWGDTMGHGADSKFYVVKFEVDDAVADGAYKVKNLDGIGDARAIDVDKLNGNTKIKGVNSQRVKCG